MIQRPDESIDLSREPLFPTRREMYAFWRWIVRFFVFLFTW